MDTREWLESLSDEQLEGFKTLFSQGGKDDDEYISKSQAQKMIQKGIEEGVKNALADINPRLGAMSQKQGRDILFNGLDEKATEYLESMFKDDSGKEKEIDFLSIALDKKLSSALRMAAEAHAQKSKGDDEPKIEGDGKPVAGSKELDEFKNDMAKMGVTYKDDAEAKESFDRVSSNAAAAGVAIQAGQKVAV